MPRYLAFWSHKLNHLHDDSCETVALPLAMHSGGVAIDRVSSSLTCNMTVFNSEVMAGCLGPSMVVRILTEVSLIRRTVIERFSTGEVPL